MIPVTASTPVLWSPCAGTGRRAPFSRQSLFGSRAAGELAPAPSYEQNVVEPLRKPGLLGAGDDGLEQDARVPDRARSRRVPARRVDHAVLDSSRLERPAM